MVDKENQEPTTEEQKTEKEEKTTENVESTQETVENSEENKKEDASEVKQLKNELAEKDDQIVRLSAEIQNMRRRFQNERQDLAKYRSQSLANDILPVLDNLERALAIEVEGDASENLKKGVEMVQSSLIQALASEGIEEVNPLGEIFDPNFHQSVSSVPKSDDQEDEEIVEVYQKGYMIKDRVLRPAMVIIAQ
ncbi:MAG: nucleotide exchange factor GrpE [Aerococcus suis]|nr:nucleotide exchange factor GrpE [Aerococcus suis]MDD7758428.1 nucleotide exchange factor GrpE [Aerococcus suis]